MWGRIYEAVPLKTLERAWMASPSLAVPSKPLTVEELSQYPIGAQYADTIHARLQSAWFTRAGHPLRNAIQAHSLSVLGQLTISGLTVAQLPVGIFSEQLKSKKLLRISVTPELPDVQYFAVYRRSTAHHLAPKIAGFAQIYCNFNTEKDPIHGRRD
jgi:DNA-binding transcriptional LysR family regulator